MKFGAASWQLTSLKGKNPLPKTTITLDFLDGSKAGGSSGCNFYNTSYSATADGALSFGMAASTLKACPEPVMKQEQEYLAALGEVTAYAITADTLTVTGAGGESLAEFSLISQELAGTAWDVLSYSNGKGGVVSIIGDTSPTAEFGEDRVGGSAGCNNYAGPYESEKGAISIGLLAATKKICFGEGVMEQEAAFLAALPTAATYKISAGTLELRRADGALVAKLKRAG